MHYAGLPPGHYIFEVAAAGPNGMWSPAPARFVFSIRPPWWQSWWFVTSCLAMVLFTARTLWRLRVRALLAQKKLLEQQVADRTDELRESHRELEKIAFCDALTSLHNRRMFTEQFRSQLALARRYRKPLALLLIDLDHFKQINDKFGHDAGDAVLIETAARLRVAVRESDCVARFGGDEFAILLTNADDKAGIEAVCRRIVDGFAVAIPFKEANLNAGCSVGIALFPDDGDTEDDLYKSADLALYEAKQTTRNTFCWHRAQVSN